jgi:hypothetical protein
MGCQVWLRATNNKKFWAYMLLPLANTYLTIISCSTDLSLDAPEES